MKISRTTLITLTLAAGGVLAAGNPPAVTHAGPMRAAPPCIQNANSSASCANMQGMSSGMRGHMMNKRSGMGPGMHGQMMNNRSGMNPGMRGQMMNNPSGMRPGMQRGMRGTGPGPATAGGQKQQVFGWQLMTPAELDAYRAKMRSAKTPGERSQIRAKHHKAMLKRAKERGVTLPPQPPGGE